MDLIEIEIDGSCSTDEIVRLRRLRAALGSLSNHAITEPHLVIVRIVFKDMMAQVGVSIVWTMWADLCCMTVVSCSTDIACDRILRLWERGVKEVGY